MKGKVLDFNIQESTGVISGEDGNRYNFTTSEWKSSNVHPAKDVEVDFDTNENNAIAIYTISAPIAENNTEEFEKAAKGVFGYYIAAFKKYATFSGRATRSEFWYFQLVSFIISLLLSVISAGILGLLYSFAVLVPSLAIGTRRLHDTGKSGWWQLLMIIPLIGIIVMIIFWAQDTKSEKNQFDIA